MNSLKTVQIDHEKFGVLGMYSSFCMRCKHFNSDDYNCSAFPEVIPDKYLSGEEKHTHIDADQVGDTVFEDMY